jgi:hypothetical protein
MLAAPRRPVTAAEWGALDESVPGELVGGAPVGEEMPSAIHEAVVLWLLLQLAP